MTVPVELYTASLLWALIVLAVILVGGLVFKYVHLRGVTTGIRRSRARIRKLFVASKFGVMEPLVTPYRSTALVISSSGEYSVISVGMLARLAGDTPLPGLRIVVIDGADAGEKLLETAGVAGARVLEPVDLKRFKKALHLKRLPILLDLNNGRVISSSVGRLTPERIDELLPLWKKQPPEEVVPGETEVDS